mgnify:CR=1 FL=1
MIYKEKNWRKAILNKSAKIKIAIKCLNKTGLQIILVESNNKFLGTITDGDIRRGLVNGLSLDDTIEKITFKNSVITNENVNLSSITNLMNINSIKSLPIVDKKKKFVDYTLPSQMKVIQKSQLLFLWQVERGKGYFL